MPPGDILTTHLLSGPPPPITTATFLLSSVTPLHQNPYVSHSGPHFAKCRYDAVTIPPSIVHRHYAHIPCDGQLMQELTKVTGNSETCPEAGIANVRHERRCEVVQNDKFDLTPDTGHTDGHLPVHLPDSVQ